MKCTRLLTWLILVVVVIGGKEKRAESAANNNGAFDHFGDANCPHNPSCAARIKMVPVQILAPRGARRANVTT